MVNRGISRACDTCRRRRKRVRNGQILSNVTRAYLSCQCDETRPICTRCQKANVTCLGYRSEKELIFRRSYSGPVSVTALPPAGLPREFRHFQIEECALTAFFHNYVVPPANDFLSRGYLAGLESLLVLAGPEAEISQACKMVAFASLGNRHNIPALLYKSRLLYANLLRSFATTVSIAKSTNVVESFLTAVLLGLYELITANLSNPSSHITHSRGASAILRQTPYQAVDALRLNDPAKVSQDSDSSGIIYAPFSNGSVHAIDTVLVDLHPLLQKTRALLSNTVTFPEDVGRVLQEAMRLDKEYSKWPASQPDEWRPWRVEPCEQASVRYPEWWPRKADFYFDLYVAAAWNTYRKTRLMLLDVIMQCLNRLQVKDAYGQKQAEIAELADAIMSSIPFHVTDQFHNLMQQPNHVTGKVSPGKSVGGLLLMHPVYVAANLDVVSPHLRAQMRNCLAWIGEHMGIGQATVFSKVGAGSAAYKVN
ncbi:uncharacterized protein Z518_00335 [Rhinocladiella mackenziei CBS 650.93]|uniref:Zn(2)-C6 fungal-type domain-containing protein n=1 Tax=Rhinocladiella mackenziei CBS 650.93 TaxID=1442369 RepID=A0A0D2J0P6_9EURO|nr:uncharacterized protein Z518_00335 [Rhinocladiella mackenziei CBS 650.93]KIX09256.1 hypothetical protein Z518_00335 [Rhinocladiella mackenziei CBS 650.93]